MHLPLVTVLLSVILPLITAASIAPREPASNGPAHYDSLTIRNSNCPCQRHNHKWCFEFVKYDVRDMACYDISQPSLGFSIYDPWVSASTPLECAAYRERGCQGEGIGWQTWKQNHECKQFGDKALDGSGVEGVTWFHRSFRCRHLGWPEHNVTQGHISMEDGGALPQARQNEKKRLDKAVQDRKEDKEKWDLERKRFWRERTRMDALEDKRYNDKERHNKQLRDAAIQDRRNAILAEGDKAREDLIAFGKLHGGNETAKIEESKMQFARDQERKTRLTALKAEQLKELATYAQIQKGYVAETARKRKERDDKEREKDRKKVLEFEKAEKKDQKRLQQLKNMGVKGV